MEIEISGRKYKTAYIERVLGLPVGTIENSHGNDPALDAVLKLISLCPWLLDVAESNFDPVESKKILVRAGAEMACAIIESNKKKPVVP